MMTKETYIRDTEARIKETDAKIDLLKSRLERMDDASKTLYKDDLHDLYAEKDSLKKELNLLREASNSEWENMKAAFDKRWEAFKDKVEEMAKR